MLINDIAELAEQDAIISIEGRCCSGKTTLAGFLQKRFGGNIFHMDDFFLMHQNRTEGRLTEPGGNVDYERFLEEVLLPLTRKETVNLKAYNCHTGKFKPDQKIPYKKLNIIEGSYSMHPTLAKYYNYSIFMTVDCQLQKERILKRSGSLALDQFIKRWIPLEELYLKEICPEKTSNYTLFNWQRGDL